jgi:uncharacterized repeat protein (TIGR03806 family)
MSKLKITFISFSILILVFLSFSFKGNSEIDFLPLLSEYELFEGKMSDLKPAKGTETYELTSHLFVDYSEKDRLIRIPPGTKIIDNGNGLPAFPDGTILVKTFFYFKDKSKPALGKNIIETRLMIKSNSIWNYGTYIWNDKQTDAVLSVEEKDVRVPYKNGDEDNIFFHIPSNEQCAECHKSKNIDIPIGPKLRNMNFNVFRNGEKINQLEYFQEIGWLEKVNVASITAMPNWEDTNLPIETRVRAYMDMNCAHCHNPKGSAFYKKKVNFEYETPFNATGIQLKKAEILKRIFSDDEERRMPNLGTSIHHVEGNNMLKQYLISLPDE